MGNPITWQNIRGPSVADGVAGFMNAAQSNFTQGFGALEEELKRRTEINTANTVATKANNTAEFRNLLMGAQSPEQWTQLQNSGQIEALQQRIGAGYDRDAMASLQDGRGTALQQQAAATMAYDKQIRDKAEEPLRNIHAQLVAGGSAEDVGKFQQDYPEYSGNAMLSKEFMSRQEGMQDRTLKNAGIEAQTAQTLTQKAATEQAIRTQQAAAEVAASKEARETAAAAEARLQKRLEAARANGVMAGGTAGSKEGQESLRKVIQDRKLEPWAQNQIMEAIAEIAPGGRYTTKDKNGKTITHDMPADVFIKAAMAAYDPIGPGEFKKTFLSNIEKQMGTNGEMFERIVQDAANLESIRREAGGGAVDPFPQDSLKVLNDALSKRKPEAKK